MMGTYLVSIVGVSLAIVLVALLFTTLVVIGRDDTHAQALAMTVASELSDAHDALDAAISVQIQHELDEQRWFRRTIEVWRDQTRIGGTTQQPRLRPWSRQRGCHLTSIDGTLIRVCAVAADPHTTIVVASPVAPMLRAELSIFIAIALSALLAALGFAVGARRLVRRNLRPLQAFERHLAAMKSTDGTAVAAHWGAAEIDQLAATFNALRQRIHDGVERERTFVANAAHELRTPLTRLRGQIELVLQDNQRSDESTQRLVLAARNCDELSRSVDALLALARNETGAIETVDMGELLSECLAKCSETERARVQVAATEAIVRADAALLSLATGNLVDNALKYSDGPVMVSVRTEGTQCVLTVSDEGGGILPAELATVRAPFVRGQRHARSVRGSGLGLALVDHVATLHHATLTLDNTPTGLRASITLPCWKPE